MLYYPAETLIAICFRGYYGKKKMLTSLLLLDVAPDPVRGPIIGIGGLILIVVLVLTLAAAGITGIVFLLWLMRKSRRRNSPRAREGAVSQFQPSSPNQP